MTGCQCAGCFGDGHDARVVNDFQRFLRAIAPGVRTRRLGGQAPLPRGWRAYMLGLGPAPPPHHDDVPLTAWRFPG